MRLTIRSAATCADLIPARKFGNAVFTRKSKCSGSRKKSVLLVVMALIKYSRSSPFEPVKRYSPYSSMELSRNSRARRISRLCTIVIFDSGILMPSSPVMNCAKRAKLFCERAMETGGIAVSSFCAQSSRINVPLLLPKIILVSVADPGPETHRRSVVSGSQHRIARRLQHQHRSNPTALNITGSRVNKITTNLLQLPALRRAPLNQRPLLIPRRRTPH